MAYRRRQGLGRSSTFEAEMYQPPEDLDTPTPMPASSVSLVSQTIRASAGHRPAFRHHSTGGGPAYDYTSMGSSNKAGSFWGVLARKAKAILDEDHEPPRSQYPCNSSRKEEVESYKKMDNPKLRKGIDSFTSSMNCNGDTIVNALEEGCKTVENKTVDFMQETRTLQIRRRGFNSEGQNLTSGQQASSSLNQITQEDQLKASRDVAMATAAKAKLLLRELKTVNAELAFAKQRCSQLEEENKILREAREKGVNPADDDMIRRQLETLLAEKARLAHENSVYARENRFLREIVEYHQLTMQDVVYLDEGIEEVTEMYPVPAVSRTLSASGSTPSSPTSNSSGMYLSRNSSVEAPDMTLMNAAATAEAAQEDSTRQQ